MNYYSDWELTNIQEERSDEPRALPKDFECEMFNEEQLKYLGEYFEDYRKKYISDFVAYIAKPLNDIDKNDCNRKVSTKLKQTLYRLLIIHKLLNNKDASFQDYTSTYNLSNHVFYEVRNNIVKELAEKNKSVKRVVCKYKTF